MLCYSLTGAGAGAGAGTTGVIVIFTTLSYLLSAPLAESMIEAMPAVSRMSTAMFTAIVAETPE